MAAWMSLAAAMAVAAMAPDAPAEPDRPPLPAYAWLFDEGTGTTAVASIGGQNGALSGGASFDRAEVPFAYRRNHAIQFNGSSSALVTMDGMAGRLNGLSAFTFSVRVNADLMEDRGILRTAGPNDGTLQLRNDASGWINGGRYGNLYKYGVSATNGIESSESSPDSNLLARWVHLALVYDDSLPTGKLKLYINGRLDPPSGTTGAAAGRVRDQNAFVLGVGGKDQYYDGHMDEPAVWETALTAQNIEWLSAHSLATLLAGPPPGTVLAVQ